ncbi:hypothetical protein [Campylobacter sp. RM16187]|uniref:hypothetical protein n=1 Tax=Campylobacter sp. RM16187 TaxID=1660063 RepID=UPI0021B587A5|nr:hypothetical protein [Campylobacter sp. RM16187]QKG29368.1 hypothetical protein CDOMF_1110 [Campylobacter sp. RM16187]
MNDFFDSLKDIKKEMIKELGETPKKEVKKQAISKEEAIAHKEEVLREEFLKYVKDSDIKKI